MSDPTWVSRVLIDGADATLYAQAEGTAAPVDGDMVAFVTDVSASAAAQINGRGPYLRSNRQRKTHGGTNYTGSFTVDVASGADAIYALLTTAVDNGTRLKLTFALVDGPTYTFRQCLVSDNLSGSAGEGYTNEFSFEADDREYTAAA